MSRIKHKQAMTLIEILVSVSIIALLAAFLIPAVQKAIERRQNALCASHMRMAVNAFELYRSENGGYPADRTPSVIPPEMVDYFRDLDIYDDTDEEHDDEWWVEKTAIGGRWDWDNGYHYPYSVSISAPTISLEQLKMLDRLLDDGNLDTGHFRKSGTQYHYILEE